MLLRFQLTPRVYLFRREDNKSHIYSHNQSETFKEVDITEKEEVLFKNRRYNIITDSGRSYFSNPEQKEDKKGFHVQIYEVQGEEKVLFTLKSGNRLVLVSNDYFVIQDKWVFKLYQKQKDGEFIKQDHFHFKHYGIVLRDKNTLIYLDPVNFGYVIIFIDKRLPFLRVETLKEINAPKRNTITNAILLNNEKEEIVIYSDKLYVIEAQEVVASFFVDSDEGQLYKVVRELFLFASVDYINFYRKVDNKWLFLQTLKFNPLRDGGVSIISSTSLDNKILIIPPSREELIAKAKLLPFDLPLDLKIEIAEFCVSNT
jgi:hypothetical protein